MPECSVEGALALMDDNGIAMSILSIPHAAQHGDEAEASGVARKINDALAEIVARHPTRFGTAATVPGHLPDATLRELEYALDILKFDGSTSTNLQDVHLGEAQCDPWFEELDRRRATLFIHPRTSSTEPQMRLGLNFGTHMLADLAVLGAKSGLPT